MENAKKEKEKVSNMDLVVAASADGAIDYASAAVRQVIKNAVAPNATAEEFATFIMYCQTTGLNPLKKEIWFIKDRQGRVNIMTGIWGFREVANRHPEYNGCKTTTDRDKAGNPVRSVCLAYRKDRSLPSEGKSFWHEDAGRTKSKDGNLTQWGQRPTLMLEKVAEARALRALFTQRLGGVYLEEEFDREQEAIDITERSAKVADLDAALAGAVVPADQLPQRPPDFQPDPEPGDVFDGTIEDVDPTGPVTP